MSDPAGKSVAKWIVVALLVIVLSAVGYWWCADFLSLSSRYRRVGVGMSEADVVRIMGPTAVASDSRFSPQVSGYAEVWTAENGEFVRHEYRGMDAHTQAVLDAPRYSVWRDDDSVVIVEFDSTDRVCGKIRLTE